jgi:hypothetical protein
LKSLGNVSHPNRYSRVRQQEDDKSVTEEIRTTQANLAALRRAHQGNDPVTHRINSLIKLLAEFQLEPSVIGAGLISQTMTELSNLLPGEK